MPVGGGNPGIRLLPFVCELVALLPALPLGGRISFERR